MAMEFSWPLLGVVIPSIIIAFCGYGTLFYIVIPHHTAMSQVWTMFMMINMIWLSYTLAITTPPGSPDEAFAYRESEWKRWCIKCQAYKPERTHHCRQCKTCVLKMDHHCPWTNNCVGNNNFPHFLRFVVWVDLTCIYALSWIISNAVSLYKSRHLPAYLVPKSQIVATICLLPSVGFVLLTVGILTGRVIYNALNGQTQIETWESERVETLVRRHLVPHVDFPYDIGLYTNLEHALGPWWSWIFPWAGPGTDGHHFEKNEAADGGCVWPPDHVDQLSPEDRGIAPLDAHRPRVYGGHAPLRLRSPAPEWRRDLTSDEDFYRTDQWQNFEGESISDFGVDIETVGLQKATGIEPHYHSVDDGEDDDENVPLAALVH